MVFSLDFYHRAWIAQKPWNFHPKQLTKKLKNHGDFLNMVRDFFKLHENKNIFKKLHILKVFLHQFIQFYFIAFQLALLCWHLLLFVHLYGYTSIPYPHHHHHNLLLIVSLQMLMWRRTARCWSIHQLHQLGSLETCGANSVQWKRWWNSTISTMLQSMGVPQMKNLSRLRVLVHVRVAQTLTYLNNNLPSFSISI